MKNSSLMIAALFIGICTSCGNKQQVTQEKNAETSFHIIKLAPKEKVKDHFLISHIADSVEYIPLETNDSVVIGKINKIVFFNNNYYILDGLTEKIFCFDHTGKFLKQLDKKGFGPDEYYSITDFNVSKNGLIWVYSSAQAFFVYDMNNKLSKKTPTKVVSQSFWVDDNDTANIYIGGLPNPSIFSDFPNQYAFVRLYEDKIISKSMPYTYHDELKMNPAPKNIISGYGDSISLFDYYDNKIYSITNGQLKPRYKISFFDDKYTLSLNNTRDKNKEILKHVSQLELFDLLITDNILWIKYNYKNRINSAIYIKKEKDFHNLGYIIFDDINNYTSLPQPSYVDDNGNFIGHVEPIDFKNCIFDTSSQHLKALKMKLKDTDNPVIIKINTKKRWE